MRRLFFTLLCTLVLLAGCSDISPEQAQPVPTAPSVQDRQQATAPAPATDDTSTMPQGYLFEAYGQAIYVCAEATPIIANLPEPKDIFEAPSCAFDGIDITYFYPGFELTTYPENGEEHVLSVVFTDDSVTTPEGVYLGGTLENIKKAYGEDFTQNGGQLAYSKGQGSLVFSFENDVIAGIVYMMIIGE